MNCDVEVSARFCSSNIYTRHCTNKVVVPAVEHPKLVEITWLHQKHQSHCSGVSNSVVLQVSRKCRYVKWLYQYVFLWHCFHKPAARTLWAKGTCVPNRIFWDVTPYILVDPYSIHLLVKEYTSEAALLAAWRTLQPWRWMQYVPPQIVGTLIPDYPASHLLLPRKPKILLRPQKCIDMRLGIENTGLWRQ
jgi:hypothetical protein